MSSSGLSLCKQTLKSRIIYESATFCPLECILTLLLGLICSFLSNLKKHQLILQLSAGIDIKYHYFIFLQDILFPSAVSLNFWACFLSLILFLLFFFLFACPRVNGEAFDINTKLEACMFLCSFLTASSVSEGPSVSSSVQYVTVPTSVGAVWSSHCASRSLFCSGFFLFWKKKSTLSKHFLYMVVE